MNKILTSAILSCFISTAYSKNNNILSQVTEPVAGEVEVSLESNMYENVGYLTPTFSYTTEDKSEYSFSIQNIPVVNKGAQNYEYDMYFGVTEFFKISDDTAIMVGALNGFSIQPFSVLHSYEFIDFRYRPINIDDNYIVLHGGPYFVNKTLSTTADEFGYQLGLEASYYDFILNMDYVSGRSNVSGAVVTFGYQIDKHYKVYTGVSVPGSNSGNEFYGILGFNYTL